MSSEPVRARLSPLQEGMLFHHLADARPGVDVEQVVCDLPERVDEDALREAWRWVTRRHPALRSRFLWRGVTDPVREVTADDDVPFRTVDLAELPRAERDARLEVLLDAERERGFDLARAPLQRLLLVRLAPEHHRLAWTFPHIVADGRSFGVVLGEAFDAYAALARGDAPDAPPPPDVPPPWEDAVAPGEAEAFWKETLAGADMPTPLPFPARGAAGSTERRGHVEVALGPAAAREVERFARGAGVRPSTVIQGAWALLLGRHAGRDDVVLGVVREGRRGSEVSGWVGVAANSLPERIALPPGQTVGQWLRTVRAGQLAARRHQHTRLVDIGAWTGAGGVPLFESLLVYDRASLGTVMRARGGAWQHRWAELRERTNVPLTLYVRAEPDLELRLAFDEDRVDPAGAAHLVRQLASLVRDVTADEERTLDELLRPHADELALLEGWNGPEAPWDQVRCVHELVEARVATTPEAVAVEADTTLTYGELDRRAGALARRLRARGVGPDVPVGVHVERSADLVVAVLGVLKAGGAYLPLDPDWPAARLAFMVRDAGAPVVITGADGRPAWCDVPTEPAAAGDDGAEPFDEARDDARRDPRPSDLAYVIYTSGSTGTPKGVMVEHRNVTSFFAGMDRVVERRGGGVWLALTSLSFDIAVLELLWTLARGFRVVLHPGAVAAPRTGAEGGRRALEFSLFYFAADEGAYEAGSERYRLLLDGARFADAHGFAAVWTPERHFHAFGGLYPNPAVTAAALATITERVDIRAGSCVLPLHHPVRVAEDWSVVDNLSDGRVGVAFASGWQPNDFVLAPGAYADRKARLLEGIETVRRLWRGEAVELVNPRGDTVPVRTLPRPVQDDLPVWITTAGSAESYETAGRAGAGVLTHLLGQTLDEIAEKVDAYRAAWSAAGHPGGGRVALMLHAFVDDDLDEVRETVREPLKAYLRSAASLVKGYADAWSAYQRARDGADTLPESGDLEALSETEMESLLDFAFERYFASSGLMGTPESCLAMAERVAAAGVDEIACLVDFGVEPARVLEHLEALDDLRARVQDRAGAGESVARALASHGVTHLQATPSTLRLLLADPEARRALAGVRHLYVGGEALPADLVEEVQAATGAALTNLYGPTETTVWSTAHPVAGGEHPVPIGRPIANATVRVQDDEGRRVPVGVPGELAIGGPGVARGYLGRPELTAERFVDDAEGPGRLYRTGDRARFRADGTLEFLGRDDGQVKVRGHRIELGEVETRLRALPGVADAVAAVREVIPGDARLVAWYVPDGSPGPARAELREALRAELPAFMTPQHLVRIEGVPLTANGKIDRLALPAPPVAGAEGAASTFRAPEDDVQETIARIWRETLGAPRVGIDDNFFDLGGHSLLAVRMQGTLERTFGRTIPITDLFRFPTVRTMALHLADGPGEEEAGAEKGVERARRRKASGRRASELRRRS